MNILPKKRWHVRTKDNIARVRKDEAAAREEEEKRKKQLEIAESEARINFLRKQSGLPTIHAGTDEKEKFQSCDSNQLEHVDLFADYKSHIKTTNKELEKEKKEEQEKYEKQIGYLTYLGQDTNEALKQRSWYEVAPKRRRKDTTEINEKELKIKQNHDPLTFMKALLPAEPKVPSKSSIEFVKETSCITTLTTTADKPNTRESSIEREIVKRKHNKKEKKHKSDKHKKHSKKHSSKKKKKLHKKSEEKYEAEQQKHKKQLLERLRQERLRREAIERARQEALLTPQEKLAAQEEATTKKTKNTDDTPRVKQKYNSQFNPEIAKQNM